MLPTFIRRIPVAYSTVECKIHPEKGPAFASKGLFPVISNKPHFSNQFTRAGLHKAPFSIS